MIGQPVFVLKDVAAIKGERKEQYRLDDAYDCAKSEKGKIR
jgi:hypothetical protein